MALDDAASLPAVPISLLIARIPVILDTHWTARPHNSAFSRRLYHPLPETLLWCAIRRNSDGLVADVSFSTCLVWPPADVVSGSARVRRLRDGCLVAGLGAASVLYQHGLSQYYFLRAAFPIAAAGSAWGIALLLRHLPLRAVLVRLVSSFALGIGLTFAVSALNRQASQPGAGDAAVAWRTTWRPPGSWSTVTPGQARRSRAVTLALCSVVLLGSGAVLSPTVLIKMLVAHPCQPVATQPSCADAVRRVPWQGERRSTLPIAGLEHYQ
jgi:hypothetical protein